MPRLRKRAYELGGKAESDLLMALQMGPTQGDGFTEDDLRVGWEVHGERIMGRKAGRGPGTRPWGWWRFAAGEEQPRERRADEGTWMRIDDHGIETIRLAELGELMPEELAALGEDANVARPRSARTPSTSRAVGARPLARIRSISRPSTCGRP